MWVQSLEFRCYPVQKLRCVIFYVLLVMATIFELPLTHMSESVPIVPAVLLDIENVGVAFGILLLS